MKRLLAEQRNRFSVQSPACNPLGDEGIAYALSRRLASAWVIWENRSPHPEAGATPQSLRINYSATGKIGRAYKMTRVQLYVLINYPVREHL